MLVLESLLGKALHSKDNMQETTDESDETLSLCDLPLYSDQSEEDLSAESQGSSSISSSEQDYFEFFSQELSPTTTGFPPESIIFCGKLIPYKKTESSLEKDSSKLVHESKKQTNIKKKRGWGLFRWKFSLSKNSKKGTTLMHKDQSGKKMYNSNKHEKGHDLPVHKMSILTSSSSGKARWYLFLFGISRFSSEVELSDIKNRQSRRHLPAPPTLNGGSGLSRLIRVLSCGGNHHPNTMVVPSTTFTLQK
ncbi:hypothetical protein DH2020_030206 [Rehmannia glutinosa]|uniref:Uncharacterized protein n=1 Tax=Rehmannia glutinosa TaxID=99300 RepID=A0ABR0VLE8_REHGL